MLRFLLKQFVWILLITESLTPQAKDHVLIMTISEYQSSTLIGVKHDADNALRLAQAFGYQVSDATVLKDNDLTASGIRRAFEQYALAIDHGDRAFIYYSGHGASFHSESVCKQAIVSQDEKLITTAELIGHIRKVKHKVSDAIVIFDACHSGGNKQIAETRSIKNHTVMLPLAAKVWTPKDGESCSKPINVLDKSWQPSSTRSMANPEFNFTFIAAANEKEVALDNPQSGGLATVALLSCAENGVADNDGNQSINYKEIVNCAQQYINQMMPALNVQSKAIYNPQTVEIYGNPARTIPVQAVIDSHAPLDRASRVISAFKSIEENSNGNWLFNAFPSRTVVPIGQKFNIQLKSDTPGYVYLLYVGSDYQEMAQVWPALGQHIQIPVGNSVTPSLKMYGPAGDNTILMVVSQSPVNFSSLFTQNSTATLGMATLANVNCLMQNQRNIKLKEDQHCPANSRNIKLKEQYTTLGSVTGYSARLFVVKGVR